jgi:hypothetical protein
MQTKAKIFMALLDLFTQAPPKSMTAPASRSFSSKRKDPAKHYGASITTAPDKNSAHPFSVLSGPVKFLRSRWHKPTTRYVTCPTQHERVFAARCARDPQYRQRAMSQDGKPIGTLADLYA